MLMSDTTTVVLESDNAWNISLLSFQIYDFLLSSLFLFREWKEKQLGNISISWSPRENLKLKGINKGKTSFNLLFVSITELLSFNHYLRVSFSSNKQLLLLLSECLNSISDLIIWLDSNNCVLSWNLLSSFCRYKCIGIRPASALIPKKEEVQKASRI